MDITQQPLVSDSEIQQLLNTAAHQSHGHRISNQYAAPGEHPSEVIGTGMDFADRQPYTQGDDPRFIDWRASARSSQTLIRRYHTELSAPSCIVIDRRASMRFGTKTRLKATQAVRAGIHCGGQLLKADQQLSCLVLDDKDYWQSASHNLANFTKTAQHAARACPPPASPFKGTKDNTNWAHTSDFLNQKLTQGSRLVLISDFINSSSHSSADSKALHFLSQHYNLTLLRIVDQSEHCMAQYPIKLMHNQHSFSINNKDQLKRFNQKLAQHDDELSQQLKKIKCAQHLIFTHDDISHLKVV